MHVDLDTRKWRDTPHWRFTQTVRLGRDEHGTWLAVPSGCPYSGPQGEGRIEHPMVCLVPDDAWWIASFHTTHPDVQLYVDVTTPAAWLGPSHVQAVDLDLDVIRSHDGTVSLDDADEFEDHRVRLRYPGEIVEGARASAEWLLAAIRERREPFDGACTPWLERLS